MKFERYDLANERVVWEATDFDMTLLVVHDSRPLHYWWRVRRGRKNLAQGDARDFRTGRICALGAYHRIKRDGEG